MITISRGARILADMGKKHEVRVDGNFHFMDKDPFGSGVPFSAWKWAEQRCKELVGMTPDVLKREKSRHDRDWEKIKKLRGRE